MAINPEMMSNLLGRAKAKFMADDTTGYLLRSAASSFGGMAAGSLADTVIPGDQSYLNGFGLFAGTVGGHHIGNYLLDKAAQKNRSPKLLTAVPDRKHNQTASTPSPPRVFYETPEGWNPVPNDYFFESLFSIKE